jgi:predicted RNA-binding protein with RPS1 domain
MSEQQVNEAIASETTEAEATNGSVTAAEAVAEADVETPEAQAEVQADAVTADTVTADTVTADTGDELDAGAADPVVADAVAETLAEAPAAAPVATATEDPAEAEVTADAPAAEAEAAPAKAARAPKEEAPADADGGDSTVVRMLSVGQQVKGTVKRITEFGAFVDIGVGRDGLVHISELSAKRVGKVADVLQEGQEVQLWIKKLDRDRNRISLTMTEPGKRTIRDLQKGEVVEGTVTRILPYGAFIDIGIGRDALLHVREMGEGFVAKPEDVVQVGQMVEVRVIEIARRRSRVDLSMKGLRDEPQPVQQEAQAQAAPQPEPEPEYEDNFADVEVLTPMQLAFKRAQEKSGVVLPTSTKQGKGKKQDPNRKRAQQEDIIARTLSTGKK